MDVIKQLLHKSTQALYIAIAVAVLIWIALRVLPLFGIALPDLTDSSTDRATSTKKTYVLDLLPAPGSWKLAPMASATAPTTYVHNPAQVAYARSSSTIAAPYSSSTYGGQVYTSYGTNSTTYVQADGKEVSNFTLISDGSLALPQSSSYIRNVSVWRGSSIHTGLTIYGELRNEYFTNSPAQMLIAISQNRAVVASAQVAPVTGFASAGFTRFKVVVPTSPTWPAKVTGRITETPCLLVLMPAVDSELATHGVQLTLPVTCKS